MGQMNLLKAGYTGTLGETYGVKQRGTLYAKAIPFSHTPHNQKQKDSFSAFSCLQRFVAQLNKTYWSYTGLSDKKRNRQNVLAEYFKKMVSEHEFDLKKINDVIQDRQLLFVTNFEFLEREQQFSLVLISDDSLADYEDVEVFLAVYLANGKAVASVSTSAVNEQVLLDTTFTNKENCYAIAIVTAKTEKGRSFLTAVYKPMKTEIVVNGIWFPNNMGNGLWRYADPELLQGQDVQATVSEETLNLT